MSLYKIVWIQNKFLQNTQNSNLIFFKFSFINQDLNFLILKIDDI